MVTKRTFLCFLSIESSDNHNIMIIIPEIDVEELAVEQMIASSFGDPEASSADDVVGSRGRRGTWGNLWTIED